MRTGTTFRSDEECWAWQDRRARLYERLHKAALYAVLMAAGAALLFVCLYCFARNMGAGHYDPWREAINNARSQSG